jgi:hypothetical protein
MWKEREEEAGKLNGTGVQINAAQKERGSSRRRPSPTLPPSPSGDSVIVKGAREVDKGISEFFSGLSEPPLAAPLLEELA